MPLNWSLVRFRDIPQPICKMLWGVSPSSAEQMLKGHKEVLSFGGQEVEENAFSR